MYIYTVYLIFYFNNSFIYICPINLIKNNHQRTVALVKQMLFASEVF